MSVTPATRFTSTNPEQRIAADLRSMRSGFATFARARMMTKKTLRNAASERSKRAVSILFAVLPAFEIKR